MPDTFEAYAHADATALFRLAVLLAGNRQDAEDLTQECLARVARAWQRRPPDDPHGYARRTLANLARDRWRFRKRAPRHTPFEEAHAGVADPYPDLVERTAVIGALATLPPRQRAVLVLRYYEGLTEAAVAATLGCSVSAVKTHSARGLDRLRPLLAPEGGL